MPIASQKINPCLWFDTEAEDAAKFYCSVFKNSKIGNVSRYVDEGQEIHGKPAGSVMVGRVRARRAEIRRAERRPAIQVRRGDLFSDRLRDARGGRLFLEQAYRGRQGRSVRLAEGQIRPLLAGRSHRALRRCCWTPTAPRSKRVTNAFLHMKKFDIAALSALRFDGGPRS